MLLVDEFLTKYQKTFDSLKAKGMSNQIVNSGFGALIQAVRQGEKIFFAPTTMLMLADKLRHYDATMQELATYAESIDIHTVFQQAFSIDGSWITYDKPIEIPGQGNMLYPKTAAVFFFVPSRYIETGRDNIQVYFINEQASIYDMMSMDVSERTWQLDPTYHQCPLRGTKVACTHEVGVLIPCQTCGMFLTIWTKVFGLSAIIAGQYLAARRYEEKKFTSIHKVPREKNPKKTRTVSAGYVFKVIDATEIIIQVPPSQEEQEQRPKIEQGSWVLEAMAEGDLAYKQVTTRPFERNYRSSRYVNVQGTTRAFPHGITREQPVRKSLQEKKVTKVEASAYKEKTESEEGQ